jgi:hypothetical protein
MKVRLAIEGRPNAARIGSSRLKPDSYHVSTESGSARGLVFADPMRSRRSPTIPPYIFRLPPLEAGPGAAFLDQKLPDPSVIVFLGVSRRRRRAFPAPQEARSRYSRLRIGPMGYTRNPRLRALASYGITGATTVHEPEARRVQPPILGRFSADPRPYGRAARPNPGQSPDYADWP